MKRNKTLLFIILAGTVVAFGLYIYGQVTELKDHLLRHFPYSDKIEITDKLIIIKKDDKVGVRAISGHFVVEPKYIQLKNYTSGILAAQTDQGWGYIDTTGKILIEPQFDSKGLLISPYCKVKFWVDSHSSLVRYTPLCEQITNFRNGYAKYRRGYKWGFMNPSCYAVIGPKYDEIRDFKCGYAMVRNGFKWGLVDSLGQELIKPQFDTLSPASYSDNTNNIYYFAQRGKYGTIDPATQNIIAPQFDEVRCTYQYITVRIDDKWGIIDINGKLSHSATLDSIKTEHIDGIKSDYHLIIKNKKKGLIDLMGNVVAEPIYDHIGNLDNGTIVYQINGKYRQLNNKRQATTNN